jgi:hypothetical protein
MPLCSKVSAALAKGMNRLLQAFLLRMSICHLQCINDITFVLPSVYILAKDCSWFDPFVW